MLQRNGKTFIVYSASGSWTDDYCLGMITATSTAVLSPGSWVKSSGCVFSKATTAYGPGHNTFVKSPNGAEDWMLYHADEASGGGWAGRSIRAQRLNWNPDDTPSFGTPAGTTTALTVPAGEPLASIRYEAEAATINHAVIRTGAAGGASGGSVVGYIDYADSWVELPRIWAPSAGTYALTVRFANGTLGTSTHNVSVNGGAAVALSYPVTGWDNWTSVTLDVTLRAGDNTLRFTQGTAYAELDYVELNRYEAKNAALNRADVRFTAGGASSERVVGHIDFADSWVELRNVTVPSAGTYRVRARYANGSTGGTATHLVSVNGGTSVTLSYAKGGWDNWRTSTLSVNLNAGANTIRFSKGTNYAELDCVEIFK